MPRLRGLLACSVSSLLLCGLAAPGRAGPETPAPARASLRQALRALGDGEEALGELRHLAAETRDHLRRHPGAGAAVRVLGTALDELARRRRTYPSSTEPEAHARVLRATLEAVADPGPAPLHLTLAARVLERSRFGLLDRLGASAGLGSRAKQMLWASFPVVLEAARSAGRAPSLRLVRRGRAHLPSGGAAEDAGAFRDALEGFLADERASR